MFNCVKKKLENKIIFQNIKEIFSFIFNFIFKVTERTSIVTGLSRRLLLKNWEITHLTTACAFQLKIIVAQLFIIQRE